MTVNTFEQLIAEWYEYRGYFVRRNILVGKGVKGGWQGELDVIALHPNTRHMVHIEASTSGASWETLKPNLEKKFAAGRRHIPLLYPNLDLASSLEQIFVPYRRMRTDKQIDGIRIVAFENFLNEMRSCLKGLNIHEAKIPEAFPLLRVLHYTVYYRLPNCASAGRAATGTGRATPIRRKTRSTAGQKV